MALTVLLAGSLVAAILCTLAAKSLHVGPLALLATIAVLGIANTPFAWLSPSPHWPFHVLPVLWADALLTKQPPKAREENGVETARIASSA